MDSDNGNGIGKLLAKYYVNLSKLVHGLRSSEMVASPSNVFACREMLLWYDELCVSYKVRYPSDEGCRKNFGQLRLNLLMI